MKKFLLSISSFALSFGVLNASHTDLSENAEGVALGASVPNHNPFLTETKSTAGFNLMASRLPGESQVDPVADAVEGLNLANNDQTSEKDEAQAASEEAAVVIIKHRKHTINEAGEEVSESQSESSPEHEHTEPAAADAASPNKKSTEEFPVNAEESSVEAPKGATAPDVEAVAEEPKVEEEV